MITSAITELIPVAGPVAVCSFSICLVRLLKTLWQISCIKTEPLLLMSTRTHLIRQLKMRFSDTLTAVLLMITLLSLLVLLYGQ